MKKCPVCKKKFQATNANHIYCTPLCAKHAFIQRRYVPPEPKKCPVCKKKFQPKRATQIYCSAKCRNITKRKKEKTRARQQPKQKKPSKKCIICKKELVLWQQKFCCRKCYIINKAKRQRFLRKQVRAKLLSIYTNPPEPKITKSIPYDEYFDQSMYEVEQKAMMTKVKICKECNEQFRGPNHSFCQVCVGKHNSLAESHNLSDDLIYENMSGGKHGFDVHSFN